MPGYMLTGDPGAGKTAVLRLLEVTGHVVVEEAATNVIAVDNALGVEEPWHDHAFIDPPPNRRGQLHRRRVLMHSGSLPRAARLAPVS